MLTAMVTPHIFFFLFFYCTCIPSITSAQYFEPNGPTFRGGSKELSANSPVNCECSVAFYGYSVNAAGILGFGIIETGRKIEQWRKENSGQSLKSLIEKSLAHTFNDCKARASLQICIDADVALRGNKYSMSYCRYVKKTGKNVFPTDNAGKTFRTVKPCSEFQKISAQTKESGPRIYLNGEGCVAAEHLSGYVLQHRKHLRRKVLCSDGFCATPNHAIFVHGTYTSMKTLCRIGTWKCTEQVKLVNNLKISANTRAVVGSIVITPYDVRFPIALIWVVQMLEDAFDIVIFATCLGITLFTVIFVGSLVYNVEGEESVTFSEDRRKLRLSELGNNGSQNAAWTNALCMPKKTVERMALGTSSYIMVR